MVWKRERLEMFDRLLPPHPGPLPQGEGTPAPALGRNRRLGLSVLQERTTLLPLPEGEGRREGEQIQLDPAVSYASCRSGLTVEEATGSA